MFWLSIIFKYFKLKWVNLYLFFYWMDLYIGFTFRKTVFEIPMLRTLAIKCWGDSRIFWVFFLICQEKEKKKPRTLETFVNCINNGFGILCFDKGYDFFLLFRLPVPPKLYCLLITHLTLETEDNISPVDHLLLLYLCVIIKLQMNDYKMFLQALVLMHLQLSYL